MRQYNFMERTYNNVKKINASTMLNTTLGNSSHRYLLPIGNQTSDVSLESPLLGISMVLSTTHLFRRRFCIKNGETLHSLSYFQSVYNTIRDRRFTRSFHDINQQQDVTQEPRRSFVLFAQVLLSENILERNIHFGLRTFACNVFLVKRFKKHTQHNRRQR